ncbi:hypothetical protein FC831_10520 [Clostridium botulinum]|nr:hypothetical protein [Clostridium botulinum]
MTNELNNKCKKYKLDKEIVGFLNNVERVFNKLDKLNDNKNEEDSMSMCEWVSENTNIEELNKLSDRDKFFYGLGVLTNEIVNGVI